MKAMIARRDRDGASEPVRRAATSLRLGGGAGELERCGGRQVLPWRTRGSRTA